ncbi:hypothetical protein OTU49_012764 [Cherax quadricarinatus]|uniref:Uncharacterized protein n=1 Tax=Cherax quadricarinatus TaxID=27406 RepID=A0AAW0VXG0_CHEQU|nr:protein POLR1D-like [Cherax quadricarinatus]
MLTDDELSRLAEQAILKEAKRGAQRAEISGPSGWLKCRLPSTNKTFLHNTLVGTLAANRAKEKQDRNRIEDGKRKRQMEEKEKNTYKRLYIRSSTKAKTSLPVKNGESSVEGYKICKKDCKKTNVQSDKIIMWNETGLELKNCNNQLTLGKKSNLLNKKGIKKNNSNLLQRSINFISSSNQDNID